MQIRYFLCILFLLKFSQTSYDYKALIEDGIILEIDSNSKMFYFY